ncbi:unnamed protein product [Paramecium sonneborni]|uniref:Uncharacterized protein n=1 Tax=Paramecium sonneborni TaxID=65129 RepID=A0A8S1MCH4_9CILI|nr:unnamed protein product [Paramecium sonneborni]
MKMRRGYQLVKQVRNLANNIIRQKLDRMNWTLLHMILAKLSVDFDEKFTFKINIFLNLLQE